MRSFFFLWVLSIVAFAQAVRLPFDVEQIGDSIEASTIEFDLEISHTGTTLQVFIFRNPDSGPKDLKPYIPPTFDQLKDIGLILNDARDIQAKFKQLEHNEDVVQANFVVPLNRQRATTGNLKGRIVVRYEEDANMARLSFYEKDGMAGKLSADVRKQEEL